MSNVQLVTLLTLLLVIVVHSPSPALLDFIQIMELVLSAQPTLFLAHSDKSVHVSLDSSFSITLVKLVDLELPLVNLTLLPSLAYKVMHYLPLELVSNVLQELQIVQFQEMLLLLMHVLVDSFYKTEVVHVQLDKSLTQPVLCVSNVQQVRNNYRYF